MEQLIISAVAVLGTLISLKFKGFVHKAISIGLTISVLLVWTSNRYIITGSFILFTLLSIITLFYGLTVKNSNKVEKISIMIMGFFLTISSVFKLFHYFGTEIIQLSLIVPIIITLTAIIRSRQLTREMSFMIIWLVYAISEFLKFWT